jgi:hypothetical protein
MTLAMNAARCGRQGQVKAFLDRPLKLRCKGCSSTDAVVIERDRLRGWSARRRGKRS